MAKGEVCKTFIRRFKSDPHLFKYLFLSYLHLYIWITFKWAISSVGLEYYVDIVGVTGSSPVSPTIFLFYHFNDVYSLKEL